jgi:hypothetical protein
MHLNTGQRRRLLEVLDPQSQEKLREYLAKYHWRRTCDYLGVGADVLRRALAGERIRTASIRAIRLGLLAVEPQTNEAA